LSGCVHQRPTLLCLRARVVPLIVVAFDQRPAIRGIAEPPESGCPVMTPTGYVADPPVMVLDEHARGVAVIREWVGM